MHTGGAAGEVSPSEHDVSSCDFPTLVRDSGLTLAVAESLTGGLLSSMFARMEDAGTWFRGGIVAYSRRAKEDLLAIGAAPVVSESAVTAMAVSAAAQLSADLAVAVTGVGGPDDQDGVRAGSVWIAVRSPAGVSASFHRFEGPPAEVCDSTCATALRLLERSVLELDHPAVQA